MYIVLTHEYVTFEKMEGNGCLISSVGSTLQSLMTPDLILEEEKGRRRTYFFLTI